MCPCVVLLKLDPLYTNLIMAVAVALEPTVELEKVQSMFCVLQLSILLKKDFICKTYVKDAFHSTIVQVLAETNLRLSSASQTGIAGRCS